MVMKRLLNAFLVVVFIGMVLGTFYFVWNRSQPEPQVFETETPFKTNIIKKIVANGSIVPQKELLIKSRVSGIVDELYVEAGESVRNGQLLARIKIIPNAAGLAQAEANVERAKIALSDAEKEYSRQNKLFEQQVIPEAEIQPSLLRLNLAKQELEAAKNALQVVMEGASASTSQKVTNVYSTSDGTILEVPVKKGTTVIESNSFNEGTTIASLADMNALMFKGFLEESEVGKIKEGLPIHILIAALPGKVITSKLNFISPKGTDVNGAIQFEIKSYLKQDKENYIRAGYSANAEIVLDSRDSVMAVREGTIGQEGSKRFVEVKQPDGTFKKQWVSVGLSDDINTEIIQGLNGDERIKSPLLFK